MRWFECFRSIAKPEVVTIALSQLLLLIAWRRGLSKFHSSFFFCTFLHAITIIRTIYKWKWKLHTKEKKNIFFFWWYVAWKCGNFFSAKTSLLVILEMSSVVLRVLPSLMEAFTTMCYWGQRKQMLRQQLWPWHYGQWQGQVKPKIQTVLSSLQNDNRSVMKRGF